MCIRDRPKGGDRDQIKAVAAGECDVTLANTYYLGGMVSSGDESEKQAAAKVAVFWPCLLYTSRCV